MGLRNLFGKSKPKKETKIIVVEVKKPKNFTYLQDLINSGEKEINLDSDIILDDDEKYKFISGIKADTINLIVNGNGHTIDARGKTRIFDIDGRVTFRNVTFKNGYSESDGGAIKCFFSTVKFEGCIFENNVVKRQYGQGGAIYNNGFSVTITGSVFKNNKVIGGGDGGAIYSAGDLTVTNSQFLENSLERGVSGHSISAMDNLIVIGCKFTQYDGSVYGDPIECRKEKSIIENCEFYG